jgi:diguanylate cyclase
MKDESQKYISIIFKEWLPLYDSLTPEVRAVLKNIAGQQAEALATRFMILFSRTRTLRGILAMT